MRKDWREHQGREKDRRCQELPGVCYTEQTVRKDVLARRYLVSGRVQGVGFRNYVEHIASKLEVDGYVRNRRGGSVEVYAIGAPEKLSQLRIALEKGPMFSDVTDVREEPDRVDETYLGNFTIEMTE
jgi:acylphosphatase